MFARPVALRRSISLHRFAVPLSVLSVVLLATTTACAPANDNKASSTADASCSVDKLPLYTEGKLTIATDDPAYPPWFVDNTPSNGKGFESAVAYAVAKQLGFKNSDVVWTTVAFNTSYQPGKKKFDFDINQISITADRKKAVDFSEPYYTAAQAIITLKNSKFAKATSLADFKSAQLGAQIGTTSLTAISDQIKPTAKARVYDDTTKAGAALANKQLDGIVADLPTAFYLTGSGDIKNATIAGQFQYEAGEPEQFGLLLAKGSGLTQCVDKAITALDEDGTLKKLETTWLSESASAPVLKP